MTIELLHDPPTVREDPKWFDWLFSLSRQHEREWALVSQAIKRGRVPESEWEPYAYDATIRRTIERIVIANVYPKESTFHPLDPVELMFVLRYGDLNELEILMDIENELGFSVDDALVERLIHEKTTFIQFIEMVQQGKAR